MNKIKSKKYIPDSVSFGSAGFPPEHGGYDQESVAEVKHVTWVGVFVNVGLAIVKFAGGILAKSNVLMADAVHTLSDLATDMAILIGVRFWSAPPDASHPHGHRKIETLVTLAIGIALALVGIGLGYEAISVLSDAILHGKTPASKTAALNWTTLAAMLVALVSIVSKEFLYRWTAGKGKAIGSSALVANAWHHRSDAVSSIPPLVTLGLEFVGSRFGYQLWFLDPIGTVCVCIMLLQAAWEVMEPTFASLLDASADRRLCSDIRKTVLGTDGVIDTHRIRTRVICANAVEVDLHVLVDKALSVERGHAIATSVMDRLLALDALEGPKIVDVLVHVEPGNPEDKRLPGSEKNTVVDWKL